MLSKAITTAFLHRAWDLLQAGPPLDMPRHFRSLVDMDAPLEQVNFDRFFDLHYQTMYNAYTNEVDDLETEMTTPLQFGSSIQSDS